VRPPRARLGRYIAAERRYTPLTQDLLFQLDYFRDPTRVDSEAYKKNSQLAQWNNEGDNFNSTFKDNFIKVNKLIMIKAEKDTMVFPSEVPLFAFIKASHAGLGRALGPLCGRRVRDGAPV